MTDEHKKKISLSNSKSRKGKIWVSNGIHCCQISPDLIEAYISKGYHRGKKKNNEVIVPWNKGLTKDSDDRVRRYIDNRGRK